VIGNGNVALDVARILSKTRAEFGGSDIVGHALDALEGSAIRTSHDPGPPRPAPDRHDAQGAGRTWPPGGRRPEVDPADLPPAEADAALEPGLRKSVAHLRDFAAALPAGKPKRVVFDFFARPVAVEGEGRAERLRVERTRIEADGRASGTGETYTIPCGLVVSCIGYRTSPIEGVPFDEAGGRFRNVDGVIGAGLYCVGWARRGPTGTIGTNRPDGYEVAERIAADLAGATGGKPAARRSTPCWPPAACARSASPIGSASRRPRPPAPAPGSPREKFVAVDEMLGICHN
jgi:ferredoxin--NADP+ reductase